MAHIRKDKPLCSARFSSETYFFRVDNEDIMKDIVPYWLLPIFPHAHALAHGEANLCMPFRKPGRNSIVGDDYWDNNKDYTRLDQTNHEAMSVELESHGGEGSMFADVEMEDTQFDEPGQPYCMHCYSYGWGFLYHCNKCDEWYHLDCHIPDECTRPRNKYKKK